MNAMYGLTRFTQHTGHCSLRLAVIHQHRDKKPDTQASRPLLYIKRGRACSNGQPGLLDESVSHLRSTHDRLVTISRRGAPGRGRAHGTDDRQVEQRADHRHVAQEAERNREEVAAGSGAGGVGQNDLYRSRRSNNPVPSPRSTAPCLPRHAAPTACPCPQSLAAPAQPCRAQPTLPPAGQGQGQGQGRGQWQGRGQGRGQARLCVPE